MSESNWINKLLSFLRLTHEKEDDAIVHETIEKGILFRGTNLWILVFAILVASVGLNMNSTAVIIGAMLISPLMGPINGVGYSVATYNFPLFRKSLINYGFSAGAGLVTSTLYFLLSPISAEHSEILARTSPTIYDVLIAMFGGLAGIVAISSKNKGNVIPGVAIATALMPPLCTAGYGLSIANWGYFFGAMYLFLINSVFIALASMIVSQVLKFPRQSRLLSREIKNKNIAITVVILLTVVPSVYLGYTLVQKEKFVGNAKKFVQKIGLWEGNFLLSNSIDEKTREVHLIFGGNDMTEGTKRRLMDKAFDLGLDTTKITLEQGLKIQDYENIQKNAVEMTSEVDRLKSTLMFKDKSLDSLKAIPMLGESLLKEIKAIYPSINSCSYAVSQQYVDSLQEFHPLSMVYLGTSENLEDEERMKIFNWLKMRLKTNHVLLRF